METTGPFPEILLGDRYWIGIVHDNIQYSWILFTKAKLQLPKKMKELFWKKWRHVVLQLSNYVVTIR